MGPLHLASRPVMRWRTRRRAASSVAVRAGPGYCSAKKIVSEVGSTPKRMLSRQAFQPITIGRDQSGQTKQVASGTTTGAPSSAWKAIEYFSRPPVKLPNLVLILAGALKV